MAAKSNFQLESTNWMNRFRWANEVENRLRNQENNINFHRLNFKCRNSLIYWFRLSVYCFWEIVYLLWNLSRGKLLFIRSVQYIYTIVADNEFIFRTKVTILLCTMCYEEEAGQKRWYTRFCVHIKRSYTCAEYIVIVILYSRCIVWCARSQQYNLLFDVRSFVESCFLSRIV